MMPRVTAGGLQFEYDEIGPESGEPIVLVMGFSAQMTRWTDLFREGLAAAGYRVFRFDNRDIGLSHSFDDHAPPNPAEVMKGVLAGQDMREHVPYVLDDMAADTAAVIEALGLGSAHVLGASMGGMIVQLLALNHPERVRSLIPVMTTSGDPGLPPATPEAIQALTTPPASPSKEDVVAAAVQSSRVIGSHDTIRNSAEEVARGVAADYDRSYRPMGVARQYGAILAQPRWHDRISELTVPTLVLHGAQDPLIPPDCGRDIARRIPKADYIEIEHWGHDVPIALVGRLVEEITGFLARVD
jgi:pimeloyl-ACP methyl ester carboxylesterase